MDGMMEKGGTELADLSECRQVAGLAWQGTVNLASAGLPWRAVAGIRPV